MKAVVAAFNQEKALLGAFSVIAQLCQSIVCITNGAIRATLLLPYSLQTKEATLKRVKARLAASRQ